MNLRKLSKAFCTYSWNMVEGGDISVIVRYGILRDECFLRDYGPVERVVEFLESNIGKGNKTRKELECLGIRAEGLSVEKIVSEYLERLKQGDEKIRKHYGIMAIMSRVL